MSDPLNIDGVNKSVNDLSYKTRRMIVNGVSNSLDDFAKKVEKLADPQAMNQEIAKFENGMKVVGKMFKSFLDK